MADTSAWQSLVQRVATTAHDHQIDLVGCRVTLMPLLYEPDVLLSASFTTRGPFVQEARQHDRRFETSRELIRMVEKIIDQGGDIPRHHPLLERPMAWELAIGTGWTDPEVSDIDRKLGINGAFEHHRCLVFSTYAEHRRMRLLLATLLLFHLSAFRVTSCNESWSFLERPEFTNDPDLELTRELMSRLCGDHVQTHQ